MSDNGVMKPIPATATLMRQHGPELVPVDTVPVEVTYDFPHLSLNFPKRQFDVIEPGHYGPIRVFDSAGNHLCDTAITGGETCVEGDVIRYGEA